jgi:hypothetical protein
MEDKDMDTRLIFHIQLKLKSNTRSGFDYLTVLNGIHTTAETKMGKAGNAGRNQHA